MKSSILERWEEIGRQINALQKERVELRRIILDKIGAFSGSRLTRREREVLSFLTSDPGIANKEIADKLNCAERTVKFHLSSMFEKYNVTNRRDLVLMATEEMESKADETIPVMRAPVPDVRRIAN
jgi:DNA-binding NarL/FixJ family response regulator